VLQSESQREREIEEEGEREGEEEEECSGLLPSHSPTDLPRLHIRLFNYNPITLLKNVKAPLYGKLVCVQGTVVRAGNIRPLVTRIAFQCLSCHGIQVLSLPDGKYTVPVSCLEPECRGKQFSPLRTSPQTLTVDWQTIRVQELAGDRQREAGRIPRTIEIELTSDLVDSCVPGDMVAVTAVVKATGTNEGHGRQSKDKCMFLLYLDAVSVTNNKGPDITHMQFSTKDYCGIREIHEDNNVFRLLVNSLCPNIYGHEMVKAGLVLGLFGGTQKYADCQNNIPIRGDPHVLIVGDPGLGKSQMLQSAATLAPRGVYVCGSTTSTAGLTVALSKEAGGGDFALEAGVLVLSDRGCCCIDEFDKMGSQHHALLEAMEQQSVSLAKAGLVCSLPARASILAAANPTGGHYNKAKTVSENLKMSSALLSRFDLVFILLDKPDEETDSILSEHVMALHSGANSGRRQKDSVAGSSGRETPLSVLQLDDGDERTLVEDLKLTRGSDFDPIPAPLFRKYIGYARNYIHPRLSEDAAKILQKFYKELRRSRHCVDSSPVTTRQLESLIRLTEARARLELREEATEQDARNVVEIMKFSMYDTFTDEFGMVDFKRSKNGSGMSQHSQAKRLVCALTRAANQTSNAIFTVQQIKDIARDIGIRVETVSDLIFTLNNESYILKKGPRTYQLQTAD
jgi:DNA helicase MCM8